MRISRKTYAIAACPNTDANVNVSATVTIEKLKWPKLSIDFILAMRDAYLRETHGSSVPLGPKVYKVLHFATLLRAATIGRVKGEGEGAVVTISTPRTIHLRFSR